MAETSAKSTKARKQSIFTKVSQSVKAMFTTEEEAPTNFEISSPYNFKHNTHVKAVILYFYFFV